MARGAWRTLTQRPVYENRWIRVREDVAELPDGRTTIYGVVTCADAVGVLPMLDADTVILVGQYRYVARAFMWEIPTGGASGGESHEATAQRELREEAGYEAARLTELCVYDTSKSIVDERAWLYLGEGLRPVPSHPDETESFEIRPFPFADVLRMVETSEIKDSMPVIAALPAPRPSGRGARPLDRPEPD